MKIEKIYNLQLAVVRTENGTALVAVDDDNCKNIREYLGDDDMFFITKEAVGHLNMSNMYIKMNHGYTLISELFKRPEEKDDKKDFH